MRPTIVKSVWTKNTLTMLISLVIATLSFLYTSSGQIDTDKLDSDQLYQLARQKAFAGDRDEARRLCSIIVARNPSSLDARILVGRTYAWDGRFAESRSTLEGVLQEDPTYKVAIDALTDVELWDKNYVRALEIANQGLVSFPRDEDLLFKKAKSLNNLGRDEEALLVLLRLEQMDPSRADVVSLMESIKTSFLMNGIEANYAFDRFSDVYDPMNYLALQVSRRTMYGSIFARLNYASRFSTQGTQVEVDLYPRLGDGVYAYVNYGLSQSTLFPKHRFGAEVYTKLPSSFEGSIGLRHLFFDASSKVTCLPGRSGTILGTTGSRSDPISFRIMPGFQTRRV
jgi:tetratricopeptide (TPR) repeat protein